MNDMENDFQSDIIGYLEFVSQANDKETDQHHKVLLESIQQTLEYHNNIQQAKEVLHKVLFNDWNRREFHHVDFDVPKFKRGVTTLEYLDIVIELHMETLAITQLFSMSPKLCNEVIIRTPDICT
ncbi:hypothetical protein K501DRAFT_328783 [Backusella circina FSU 941]|nr:hypothetical protein K501DRAFT_328783 [Backusella circina FSU 941]